MPEVCRFLFSAQMPGLLLRGLVVFSRWVRSLSVTPWTVTRQFALSLSISWACSNSCPLIQWCHPTVSSSVAPFSSCLQSFPASGSFPMSWLFTSGGQSSGASASASGLSRVLSSTTIQKHQFFGAQTFLWSNSHIHTWPLEKPLQAKGFARLSVGLLRLSPCWNSFKSILKRFSSVWGLLGHYGGSPLGT